MSMGLNIPMTGLIGMSVKPSVSLYYIGNVNSDVVYTDNKLILKNARFSTDNKNP